VDDATGHIDLSVLNTKPRTGSGSLVTIDFTIAGTAADGPTAIDLTSALLEGGTQPFILTPTPVPGPDGTDGRLNILRFLLDVDGDGTAAPLTDGRLIFRYLSQFAGTQLTAGIGFPANATRSTAAAVTAYLDQALSRLPNMLDVDGDGTATPLTDGRLIFRYLSQFAGTQLTGGIGLPPGATRTTPTMITAFLDQFLPVTSPSVQEARIVASAPVASSATTTTTTTISSAAPAPSVPLVVMESATATATTASVVATDTNVSTTDLSFAYVQRSWVKDFVTATSDSVPDDEELLITLPA
jgi:hypothetical protein